MNYSISKVSQSDWGRILMLNLWGNFYLSSNSPTIRLYPLIGWDLSWDSLVQLHWMKLVYFLTFRFWFTFDRINLKPQVYKNWDVFTLADFSLIVQVKQKYWGTWMWFRFCKFLPESNRFPILIPSVRSYLCFFASKNHKQD